MADSAFFEVATLLKNILRIDRQVHQNAKLFHTLNVKRNQQKTPTKLAGVF